MKLMKKDLLSLQFLIAQRILYWKKRKQMKSNNIYYAWRSINIGNCRGNSLFYVKEK